jgi:hypothetical protein
MQQHWFECRRCQSVRIIYTRGEVVSVPCRLCGGPMRERQITQTRLDITVSVQEPHRDEVVLARKSVTIPDVLYEQLTLFDMGAV